MNTTPIKFTVHGTTTSDLDYTRSVLYALLEFNGSALVKFDPSTIEVATLQQPEPEPLTYLPMEETRARLIHNALASYQASLMQQGDMETANQRNKCQQLMDTIRDTIIGPLEKLGRIAK